MTGHLQPNKSTIESPERIARGPLSVVRIIVGYGWGL